ncbi:MAG TPA: type II toxin-antitoxin system Phd/YefM family antitoxin [Polyangiaceae bacterium]
MAKEYSIADARRNLPGVVNAVEAGGEVRLTRRGKPVAVMVSVDEYERLRQKRASFAEAFKEFRKRFPEGSGGLERGYWASLRAGGAGRKVVL